MAGGLLPEEGNFRIELGMGTTNVVPTKKSQFSLLYAISDQVQFLQTIRWYILHSLSHKMHMQEFAGM
jgi:hypothetical protein